MTAMKWWGWGHEHVSFQPRGQARAGAFIRKELDVDIERPEGAPVAFEGVEVASEPARRCTGEARGGGGRRCRPSRSTGWSPRAGNACAISCDTAAATSGAYPVVRPGSEPDVEALVGAALRFDCVLIPFGGGTNISGSLEPPEGTTAVSVDMGRMSRVLEIDEASGLARAGGRVQARPGGAAGRAWLDDSHTPDSFAALDTGGGSRRAARRGGRQVRRHR